jgi:predicted nuclease of predicted toxin-antitoxin system
MSLQIVVDMNLSLEWISFLDGAGWPAVHWSSVGDPHATDATIMEWARSHHYTVFTHDLDFGTMLALTHSEGPSVVQIRTQRILPEHVGATMLTVLRQYETELTIGAIVVVEEAKNRVRVLPL